MSRENQVGDTVSRFIVRHDYRILHLALSLGEQEVWLPHVGFSHKRLVYKYEKRYCFSLV